MPKPKISYNPDELIKGIWDGAIDIDSLPEDLYFEIADRLKKSLYDGFGSTLENVSEEDKAILDDLRTSVFHFSAAKVNALVNDIQDLKTKGIEYSYFEEKATGVYDLYTDNYQSAEEYTTQGQATMAAQWQRIDEEKEALPYLVFDTQNNPCPECEPFDQFSAPVDDPVWDWLSPLLHWNCACVLRQEDANYTPSSDEARTKIESFKETNVPKEFQNNPGRTGVLFPTKHAYFDESDISAAKHNYYLDIPKTDK